MKRSEAEKLLGGHATGTLTAEERRTLFAAALDDQAIFDALMDEEALRELLADPAAKAQLLAALAPAAAPKVVPFWRRTGVLGAAASLLLAATAGLVVLRSPEKAPPPLEREAEKAKLAAAPAAAPAPVPLAKKVAPAPPAQASAQAPPAEHRAANLAPAAPRPMAATAGAAPAVASEIQAKERDLYHRAEARDKVAKKAEAQRPPVPLMEAVPAQRADREKKKAEAQSSSAVGVPGGVVGGVVGGVAGGVASRTTGSAQGGRTRDAAPPPAPAPAKSTGRVEWKAAAVAPGWTLEPQADGTTRVLVKSPLGATAVLLRRRTAGVEVLALKLIDPGGDMDRWRVEVRLAEGDVLDLYLLNAPVVDPARLPETGPVDGFRVRIYPATK